MARSLLLCVLVGCHPAAPARPRAGGVEVASDAAVALTPVLHVERAPSGDERLVARGLPALSADGRVVVTQSTVDHEHYFVYWDAATGEVLRDEPSPMQAHGDGDLDDREPYWTIDDAAVAATMRAWREAGFRTLPSYEEWIAAHPESGLRISVRRHEQADEDLAVSEAATISRGAWSTTLEPVEAVDLRATAVAPDGSFVVIARFNCACECASWHTLVPVR